MFSWRSSPKTDAREEVELDFADIYVPKEEIVVPSSQIVAAVQVINEEEEREEDAAVFVSERDTPLLWLNRVIMCTFAVTFLWSTSLQVSTAISTYSLPVPLLSSVVEHCRFAYAEATEKKRKYDRCVRHQLALCGERLALAQQREWARVRAVEASNELFLSQFKAIESNCSSAVKSVKAVANGWMSGGSGYEIPYLPQCTDDSREAVRALLGDNSQQKASTYLSVNSYIFDSNNRVVRLATYAHDLNAYNAEYLANKTRGIREELLDVAELVALRNVRLLNDTLRDVQSVVNELVACLSLDAEIAKGCPSESAYSVYQRIRSVINADIATVRAQIGQYANVFGNYIKTVQRAIGVADDFYDAVKSFTKWVSKQLSKFLGKNVVCNKTSPDWCDFSPSDWFVPTPTIPSFSVLQDMPDPSVIWKAISGEVNRAVSAIGDINADFKLSLKALQVDLRVSLGAVDVTPKDYNPPRYPRSDGNITTDVKEHESESSSFLQDMRQSIYNTSAKTTFDPVIIESALNTTSLSISRISLSSFTSAWARFNVQELDFGLLWTAFGSVQGQFYLLDYIYRAVQTARLVTSFWTRSVVRLPEIDLRRPSREIDLSFVSRISFLLRMLPLVWVQLLIFAAILVVIVWIISAVLVPEYNAYHSACVVHTWNQSYVSENLAALAINYANMDGNAAMGRGMAKYNLISAGYCSADTAATTATYSSVYGQLLVKNTTFQAALNQATQFIQCLDVNGLDRQILSACCDVVSPSACHNISFSSSTRENCPAALLSQTPLTLQASLFEPYTCNADHLLRSSNKTIVNDFGGLQSSVFQCSALPACDMTCASPPADVLTALSKDCACMGEWWWNGYVLQTLLSLFIYIVLNVSRTYICNGLLQIFWNALSPGVFQVRGECDIGGHVWNMMDGGEEKKRMRVQQVRAKVRRQLLLFQIKGVVKVVFGLAVNLSWIAVLVLLQHNIQYQPNG